jgi:hypothetical protein
MNQYYEKLRQKKLKNPQLFNHTGVLRALENIKSATNEECAIRVLELYIKRTEYADIREVYNAYADFYEQRDKDKLQELAETSNMHFNSP